MKYVSLEKAKTRKIQVRVGETITGHCEICGSACLLTRNANGWNYHTPVYIDLKAAEQQAERTGLFESEKFI